MRYRFKRYGKVDRKIDEWLFETECVRDGQEGDRLKAVFTIHMRRTAKIQEAAGDGRPSIEFYAGVDASSSSPVFTPKTIGRIEDKTLDGLRKKVQEAFESGTSRSWSKVILAGVETPEQYKNEDGAVELKFGFLVVEKAGVLYRRADGYITRDPEDLVDGDGKVAVLEWDAQTEAALITIRRTTLQLADRLRAIIKDPGKLRLIKPGALLLK